MIKLDTSFSLGSIIESNFLGISNDAEPDNVIVTLSKNMVTCFHMPSQNQVHCWSSSDKLSSGVIFDSLTNCYYGVFNYTRIGKWSQTSSMMKDMKKFNFTSKIIKLLTRLDYKGTVAVFENGHCECLKEAIGNRKKTRDAVINDGETIELAKLCIFRTKAICIIVSVDNKNIKTLRSVPLEDTFLPINLQISFKNKTDKLLGYCIRENSNSLNIVTFWSNGYLYSNELYTESNSNDFPGKQLTEITLVNLKKQVTLIQLSSDCIGLYGAEPKGDGAALVVYNFHYNMVVAVQHFRIYTNPPNLWCFGNHLLLVTGQNLAVIPFTCERNNLSLLMDNNLIKINDKYEEIEWDSYAKQQCVDTISASALSQSKLNEMIITDHIKNNKDKSLIRLLMENNDISDTSLVEILSYCSLNTSKHSNLLSKLFAYPPLNKPSCLRRQLPFENMLIILNTLYSLMKEKLIEEKLVDWMTLLIDCSYQQLLLSNDPNVLELIIKIQKDINSKCDYLDSVNNINYTMRVIKSKNVNSKNRDGPVNNLYKIEKINLY
ncbi:nucleolar protein 11 [Aphis craccivora]|uniref:Nucleolar protein 11 n=1 Tax=Aphis craccivora TaxID=307492 RepID=A0A6G0Z663_APHCR|nr:nucleolar protein 11 [Aphis craccivora]